MSFANKANNKQMKRRAMCKEEERSRKLVELMERTGNPIMQMNGQRIFGPPRKWAGIIPQKGCEIFVGKIPKFIFEDELVPIFERVGPIYRMRLMMDFSGMNRGYAFITYTSPEHANLAVTYLNNYEIRANRHIGVYKSVDNCRLFVGAIPPEKTQMEIRDALETYVEGIVDIIMYPGTNMNDDDHNRGYVFVEFNSHRSAAIARRLLGSGVKLWDTPVAVDWAEPLPEVDPAIMEKVTILYIRNLNISLTKKELLLQLSNFLPLEMIIKAHKTCDYAFVHFSSRLDAENAFRLLRGATVAGNEIEVSWARPRIYSKEHRLNIPAQNFCTSVPPRMRRLVQQQKPIPSLIEADPSSSHSFAGSSPQTSSPTRMNVNRNVCYINLHEPCMNIVNYNVMPAPTGDALP